MIEIRGFSPRIAAIVVIGLLAPVLSARGGEPDPMQSEAAEAIERLGGYVTPAGRLIPLGVVVDLEDSRAEDRDLMHLRVLKDVHVLNLNGTKVSNAGLSHLIDLDNLQVLGLERTRVTDAGLHQLTKLKKLRALDLKGTEVTDAGIEAFKNMKHLRELHVSGTRISADGLKTLRQSLRWCRIR